MAQKPQHDAASSHPRRPVTVTRRSRRLMLERLREIDQMNAKELAEIMSDSERLKALFRDGKRH